MYYFFIRCEKLSFLHQKIYFLLSLQAMSLSAFRCRAPENLIFQFYF